MDIEKELMNLKDLVKRQQDQINGLEQKCADIDKELLTISEEMYRVGKNGYPSLYDVKEKLIEKGWLEKPHES